MSKLAVIAVLALWAAAWVIGIMAALSVFGLLG